MLRADAHPFERAGLQHPQQLRLQLAGKVSDLVEEERAAGGDLEAADHSRHGAGEGAFLVAEQLALDQCGRQRRAVDRDERPRAAPAAVVERARDQLLAGSGLAQDQHRRIRRGHLLDLPQDRRDGGTAADDLVEAVGATSHPLQVNVLRRESLRELLDLERAGPAVHGVGENTPEQLDARRQAPRPASFGTEGADGQTSQQVGAGDERHHDGREHAAGGDERALGFRLLRQVVGESRQHDGSAGPKLRGHPRQGDGEVLLNGARRRRRRVVVRGPQRTPILAEEGQAGPLYSEHSHDGLEGPHDLFVDPLGRQVLEPRREVGQELLEAQLFLERLEAPDTVGFVLGRGSGLAAVVVQQRGQWC